MTTDFNTIQHLLLRTQDKYVEFFLTRGEVITDYVCFSKSDAEPLLISDKLPEEIVRYILDELKQY